MQDVCDAKPLTIRPLCPDKVLCVEFAGRWTRYLGSGDRDSLPGALSYQREARQRQVVVRHDWPMGLTKWVGICDREASATARHQRKALSTVRHDILKRCATCAGRSPWSSSLRAWATW